MKLIRTDSNEDYFIVCDKNDKLYIELMNKGIKSHDSSLYKYYSQEILNDFYNYLKRFDRSFKKTENWSKNSPWWEIKKIYDKFENKNNYDFDFNEKEKQFLSEIVSNQYLKFMIKSTNVFVENLDLIINNKNFIAVTSIKYEPLKDNNKISNQYLKVNMIKEEKITETIEINTIEELKKYSKPLIEIKEDNTGFDYYIDEVLIERFDGKFDEFKFVEQLYIVECDFKNIRFKTNTKYTIEYLEKIQYKLLIKNIKKENKITQEEISFGY